MNIVFKVFEQAKLVLIASSLLCMSLALTGCIPMIIGAVAYSGAQSDATKQKFLDDFNKTNLEREKAGFKPLEYCVELGRFDAKLAEADAECKKKTELRATDTSLSIEAKPAEVPLPPAVPMPSLAK